MDTFEALDHIAQCVRQLRPLRQGLLFENANTDSTIKILESEHRQEQQELRRVREYLDKVSDGLRPSYPEIRRIDASDTVRQQANRALDALVRDVLFEAVHTIDFTLELRNRHRLVGPCESDGVFYYLISVAGWQDALDRENHRFGYHFHHIDTSKRRAVRTNVLLTFNPEETLGPPDSLY